MYFYKINCTGLAKNTINDLQFLYSIYIKKNMYFYIINCTDLHQAYNGRLKSIVPMMILAELVSDNKTEAHHCTMQGSKPKMSLHNTYSMYSMAYFVLNFVSSRVLLCMLFIAIK